VTLPPSTAAADINGVEPVPTPPGKRLFDIMLAGTGLVLSSPVWLVLAVAIRVEDAGPIFYSQDRAGKDGRVFRAWKFRSMVPDAEKHVGAIQATAHDPRVTKVGRLMRATAMDELPQLWNIFVGDMSFVGPRALRPGEIEALGGGRLEALEDVPGYDQRSRVRPGLTGIAQIYAPRDITRRNKFRYDRLYISRQSFPLDLRLISLSFWITFRGKWETRSNKF
jgi:lipopolysaccharide/colanic/teichoic acid biosynthesis glycosyltransferase